MVYLDNSSTTFPKPECVYQALDAANRTLAFNAGRGIYDSADKAQSVIDETRQLVASFSGDESNTVVFTSSATDALNQIIYGLDLHEGDTVFVSPFEHNAVLRVLHLLEKRKQIKVGVIPFDSEWNLDENLFINLLATCNPKATFVSLVSNVTGYLLPYGKIFEIAKRFGCVNTLDASQGYGVLKINERQNTDYVVFDGHKTLYSSFGIGGFVCMHKNRLNVVKAGGTGSDSLNLDMPSGVEGFEPGSHNVVAIAGLNASCKWLKSVSVEDKERDLTRYLIDQLSTLKNVHLFIPKNIDLIFGTVSFAVDGYSSDDVGSILSDEFDIAVRTGYHCAAFVHDYIGSTDYSGTIRVSLGYFNEKKDIDFLIDALKTL